MKGSGELKGLRDARTAISTHYRSSSRHKGTPYLEILALGMERLRLEAEMARLREREDRIQRRLSEIQQLLVKRLGQVQPGDALESGDLAGAAGAGGAAQASYPLPGNLKTMAIEY
ncbi:MAG: hypothetical protein HY683_01130 [Chloroflexi bacterium]|nr:hypothetical protein [Chloroflexota bacterium]